VYLQSNNIGATGAAALGEAFKVNTGITLVNLSENNITRLPASLAQNRTITRFSYWDNPIDYIPPSVQRWLDRFQQQQNANIYKDSQNVHNRRIQQCVSDSMERIMNEGPPCYESIEQVHEVIVKDEVLTEECKEALIQYAADTHVHSDLNLTFGEALRYVFSRIESNPNAAGIKEVLNQEMSDSLCKCFTGRITRLINCLNALDPLVEINLLSENEMINMVCQQVYESLEEQEEEINGKGQQQETEEEPVATILTAENYRRQLEEELAKRGVTVTDEIRERYIDPIAIDLC
jgi:vacuolar-type H+-ATPase subunit I/STV1